MKILCAFGRHNYGDPARGESYEYANFLPAMRNLGHEVVFFDTLDRRSSADFADLNRKFLETAVHERPEAIFCVPVHYELWLETLALAKRATGACLIAWATDDSWKYEESSRFIAADFDIFATTYRSALEKAARDGLPNFVLTQWAAPGSVLMPPKPAEACRHRVSFVGAAYGNRRKWVEELRRRGIDVACFGYGWEGGAIPAADIPRIINDSAISLNFGDSGLVLQGWRIVRSRQIKARVFEVPAAGGCLLTEPAEGLDEYFVPGGEIETFAGADELAGKITRLLQAPEARDRMAIAGHRRVATQHAYEIRLRQLLDRVVTGPPGEVDRAAFERLVEAHRIGPALKALRALLVLPCQAVFGKRRGRRAARRLLFELSWRLAGRRTYCAAGLPGRLFFDES